MPLCRRLLLCFGAISRGWGPADVEALAAESRSASVSGGKASVTPIGPWDVVREVTMLSRNVSVFPSRWAMKRGGSESSIWHALCMNRMPIDCLRDNPCFNMDGPATGNTFWATFPNERQPREAI